MNKQVSFTYLNKAVMKEKPDEAGRHTCIGSWNFLYDSKYNEMHLGTTLLVKEGI